MDFEEQQKRKSKMHREWKEKERKRVLSLKPSIKKKITRKLVDLFVDFMVYDNMSNNDVIGGYYASGAGRMAGGLKRSLNARRKRFFKEYERIFGDTTKDQTTYRAVWRYIQEKYKDRIEKETEKEHIRRFGWYK